MHDSVVISQDIVNVDTFNQVEKPSQQDIIDNLLENLSNDQLDQLIVDINDEKELRKLSKKRLDKLKTTLRNEKNKLIKEISQLKIKMIQNMNVVSDGDEFDDDTEELPKKKITKTRKQIKKK